MASGGRNIIPGVGEDTNMEQEEYDAAMYGAHELPDEYSKLPTCCYCAANALQILCITNCSMRCPCAA